MVVDVGVHCVAAHLPPALGGAVAGAGAGHAVRGVPSAAHDPERGDPLLGGCLLVIAGVLVVLVLVALVLGTAGVPPTRWGAKAPIGSFRRRAPNLRLP